MEKGDNRTGLLWSPAMRGFALLWFGEMISLMGSGMTCFAQSVYVYTDLGGSIMNLTLIAVLAQVPGILISPIAGVLVDRWDRRWVMIIGNTVAAVATLTLRVLIVSSVFQIWHIYIIVIIISMANHFQWPAYFSTVPLMVPSDRLNQANGLVQMGRSIGWLAAPITAGIAVTHFKIQGIVLFDMFTYLFALAMIVIVKIPKVPALKAQSNIEFSFFKEMLFGWKYLVNRPEFRSLLVFFGFANFIFAGGAMLIIPLILSFSTPKILGSILSIEGLSMTLGGLLMSFLVEPKRKVKRILICVFLQAVSFILIGIRPSIWLIVFGLVAFSLVEPMINAYSAIIWHKKIPLQVQGRVLAASSMVSTAALQSGFLAAGLMADYVLIPLFARGGPWVDGLGKLIGTGHQGALGTYYILLGLSAALIATGALFNKSLRLLEERVPDVQLNLDEIREADAAGVPVASSCILSAK